MHLQVQQITSPPAYRGRNVVATVQLTIHAVADHTFTISGISVMRGEDALFLRMPKIKDERGVFVPFISLSAKMKRAIDDAVLPAVEKWLRGSSVRQIENDGGAR